MQLVKHNLEVPFGYAMVRTIRIVGYDLAGKTGRFHLHRSEGAPELFAVSNADVGLTLDAPGKSVVMALSAAVANKVPVTSRPVWGAVPPDDYHYRLDLGPAGADAEVGLVGRFHLADRAEALEGIDGGDATYDITVEGSPVTLTVTSVAAATLVVLLGAVRPKLALVRSPAGSPLTGGAQNVNYSLSVDDLFGQSVAEVLYRDEQFGVWEEVAVAGGGGTWPAAPAMHGVGTYYPAARVRLTNGATFDYGLPGFEVQP